MIQGPRYVAHVKLVTSSEMYEMKLDEKSIPECLEAVISFFKLDKIADFAMLRLAMLVDGQESNVYCWPSTGDVTINRDTSVKITPKQVEFRVVLWKYDVTGPLVEDVKSTSVERARDAALRIHGMSSTAEAKRILVYSPPDHKNSRLILYRYGTEIAKVGDAVTTVPTATTVPAAPVVPPKVYAYTEKKYAAKMYGIFKDDHEFN